MSRHTAETALDAMVNRPSYIEDRYAQMDVADLSVGVLTHLRRLATAVPTQEVASWEERKAAIVLDYGLPTGSTDKPFAFSNGVAIIPIHGILINRFAYSWGFVTGYNFIRSQLQAALIDPDVKLIVFDVNSYGGMAAGCEELSLEIYESRTVKPSVAIVDFNCYSAAYFVASGATRMIVTPSSGVGSIGTLCLRMDVTSALEQAGVKVTVIYAGKNKLDMNPLVPFSKGAQERLQASVDLCYETFIAAVVRNRDLTDEVVRGTEASCYDSAAALELGLIDAIQPPAAAIEAAMDDLLEPDDGDDINMTTQNPDPKTTPAPDAAAVAAASATATQTERERIKAITTCEEAAGRTKLANHLAFNTTMSADEAKAMLAVAEKEAAPVAAQPAPKPGEQPAPQATTEKPNKTDTPFHAAMDQSGNPNVTSDGQKPGGGDPAQPATGASKAAGILAAQTAATGIKHEGLTKH